MKKIRAIYIGDVRFRNCPVFELNKKTNNFIMLRNPGFQYSKEEVFEDEDFLIFEIVEGKTLDQTSVKQMRV